MIILDILKLVQKNGYFDILSYVKNVIKEDNNNFDYYLINDNLI